MRGSGGGSPRSGARNLTDADDDTDTAHPAPVVDIPIHRHKP
ncbi:hypothetical protein AB0E08_16515 [Streptomyces sp. NPDC048281]